MSRIVYVIEVALLLFFSFFSNPVLAQHHNLSNYRYMEVTKDSEIYARVGEHIVQVGLLKKDHFLKAAQEKGDQDDHYEFHFGNGQGYIEKENLKEVKKSVSFNVPLATLDKKNSENLMIFKDVRVYSTPEVNSSSIAILSANLRYPILDKLKDPSDQTWYEVNLGDRLGYISGQDAELDHGIPLLTYHHILKDKENKRFLHTSTTTSLSAFREQMDYLKQADYTTISLYELEGYLNGTLNLPAKVVGLTFDDGLKSIYRYAYPILKKNGQKATLFIISSRIKRYPQEWNSEDLQFMNLSALYATKDVFDFQSHTHFLHRLGKNKQPILFSRSYHTILYDFERSRRALSQFNPHVLYLSYPFGGYNQQAMDAARNAGFHLAVTTKQGKVKLGDNPFALKRLYILRTDSIEKMAKVIAN
ncbi:Putative xylanase/chitin deacetylase [Xenorhabdus bovienii str. puntauvense]|uniref:Putative xylanase/chitin deacetylase n=1 Tax=Xenorhabdus bovienii str. puntauvense TaxID=1398201 RepID=A0A077N862_XENBV|nr:polysaccharide deacetylase family protein [Xenorhabdus bovienii]CDG95194.1 Putative xylanase/chitin deacetylase [Xenorhabdus bovienii str. puntauvense]